MKAEIQDKRKRPIFIHSELDDLGLSPSDFRVYAHLVRRSDNHSGTAWPSIQTIASKCLLHPKTVRDSIATLVRNGLLRRTDRPGTSCLFEITEKDEWCAQYAGDPSQKDTGDPSQKDTGVPSQKDTGVPSQKDTGEGYPGRTSKKGTPTPDDEASSVGVGASAPAKPKTRTPAKNGDTRPLSDGYVALYRRHVGKDYNFEGAKDGSALKRLLSFNVPISEILDVIDQSFPKRDKYPFSHVTSLASFVSAWNRIRGALPSSPTVSARRLSTPMPADVEEDPFRDAWQRRLAAAKEGSAMVNA